MKYLELLEATWKQVLDKFKIIIKSNNDSLL
jgi:hypothetical protein